MYESKHSPGKKFGNAFQGKHYDEMHAPAEKEPSGKMESAIEDNKETEKQEGMEGHPVVAAHGKATEVHIHHDHAAGKHHVHSKHEDGHNNLSEHESPEEAHEEGGKLSGVDVKKENPEEAQQGAQSEEDGFEMPDLA